MRWSIVRTKFQRLSPRKVPSLLLPVEPSPSQFQRWTPPSIPPHRSHSFTRQGIRPATALSLHSRSRRAREPGVLPAVTAPSRPTRALPPSAIALLFIALGRQNLSSLHPDQLSRIVTSKEPHRNVERAVVGVFTVADAMRSERDRTLRVPRGQSTPCEASKARLCLLGDEWVSSNTYQVEVPCVY